MSMLTGRSMVMYDFDVDSSTAGCLDMTGEQFTEPFLIETIERRLRARPRPFALAGDWQDICQVLGEQRSLPLDGMIFHTGRCGSTLVANALSSFAHTMVLKEPPFLSALASDAVLGRAGAPEAVDRMRALRDRCLPPTTDAHIRQIWKFASWNILAGAAWSAAFPDTAQAFLWRPCLEVMESEVAAPPMWANGKGRVRYSMFREGREMIDKAGLSGLPKPQLVSLAAWLTVSRAGIQVGEAGALVVPYAAIKKDLTGVLSLLCEHLGIPVTSKEVAEAAEVRQFYSKDPSGRKKFSEPDRPSTIDSETRERIQDLVDDTESRLTKLGEASGDRHPVL